MNVIYKPLYWSYRFSSGLWYRAQRRFTLAGLSLAGAFFVAGAVGSNIESTVTYQTFATLFMILLAAMVSSWSFRAKFSARRLLPRLGTAGQPLSYRVQLRNLTKKPQNGLALLDELSDPRPKFREWKAFQKSVARRSKPFRVLRVSRKNPFILAELKPTELPTLPPGEEIEVRVELLPLQRGVLRLRRLTVARPDPFGLFRSFFRIPTPQSILVLPKRYQLPPVTLPGALRYQEGGVALASNIGRSDEFVALREYRQGDPLRNIHWRSWARIGKPIVKEFEDEFFVRHALVLDTFDNDAYSQILEEAVSVAASFAFTVLTQESLLDLLFVGDQSYCFTAGRGLAHAEQMLEILASVKNTPDKKFEDLEQLVFNHIGNVSGCICVLQQWDAPRRKLVEKLRIAGVPLLVLIIVPPGANASGDGREMVDADGLVHLLELGKIEEGLAKLK